jgi:hypothetical protein
VDVNISSWAQKLSKYVLDRNDPRHVKVSKRLDVCTQFYKYLLHSECNIDILRSTKKGKPGEELASR